MDTNENLLNNDLQIDSVSHGHLKETASWAKFISIVGIVASILLAIGAFFAGTILSRYSSNSYGGYGSGIGSAGSVIITVVYLICAVITFFVSLYLNRFATKMRTALDTLDQSALISSFQNIKVYFRVIGIILIIYLAFIVLGTIASLIR